MAQSLKKYFIALSKDSVIYGLGNVVLKLLAIVTAPILTRIFAPADYGVLSLIASVISFLSLFLIFGMDTSVFMRVHEHKDDKKSVVSSGFWFLVLWGAFLAGICIILSKPIALVALKNPTYAILFSLAFTTAFFTLLTNYIKTIYRLEFKAKIFSLVTAIGAVLITGLAIGLVFKFGIIGYFLGTLVGTIITFFLALYFVREDFEFKWNWTHAKEMAIYGSMLVPASLSYFVFDLSDRFFVSHYWNLTQLGLYAMAINVTSLLPFFSMALSKAWLPMIFDLYHKEKEVFKQFMPRIFVYYLTFFLILAVIISFFGLEILKLLTVSKYYPAAKVIGPLALAMVFSATVQLTSTGIYLAKKTKLIALCSGMSAVINLLFNFLLIPRFGMMGAAWATAISYFFLTNAYFWYSQKLVFIDVDWFRIIRLISFGALVIVLSPLTWRFSDSINLVIKITEAILFILSLVPLGIIQPEEINSIKELFRKSKEEKIDETSDEENSPVLK